MPKLNPFRVSFDGPLGSRERMRARIAATMVAGTAIILGATSALTLLNASSAAIGSWSNASLETDVRLVASEGEGTAGKACEEQTWPYIETRCLKRADTTFNKRTTPKHGLGSQQVALPAGPAASTSQPAGKPKSEASTTGSAPRADDPVSTDAAPVPAQRAAAPVSPGSVVPAPQTKAASQPQNANPRLSQREQRRLKYVERTRSQREARKKAQAETRQAKREQIGREWTENEAMAGSSRRVIVNRRDPFEDDFFRTFR